MRMNERGWLKYLALKDLRCLESVCRNPLLSFAEVKARRIATRIKVPVRDDDETMMVSHQRSIVSTSS